MSDRANDRRPTPGRQDTDAILSYYHSDDAGRQEPSSSHSLTSILTSPVLDRSNSSTRTTSHHRQVGPSQPRVALPPADPSTSGVLPRTSIPSQGGLDRRRLAVVERRPSDRDRTEETAQVRPSDPSGGGPPNNSSSCLEADLGGLALVAPPDSSLQSHSASSQPSTIPVSKLQSSITVRHPHAGNRARSSQDTFEHSSKGIGHVARKSSREIVSTASFPGSASVPQPSSITLPATNSLWPPLFQIPQSRSPSPGTSDIADPSCSTSHGRQRKDALPPGVSPVKEVKGFSASVRTQDTDGSKHISNLITSPIVTSSFPQSPSFSPVPSSPYSSTQDLMSPRTNLSTPLTPSIALTSPTTTPSPYLHYQPGLHATAGPLPPPPQAVFNIDPKAPPPPRPPRHSPVRRFNDLETMKQALQLPSHVTAVLSAKTSSSSDREIGCIFKSAESDHNGISRNCTSNTTSERLGSSREGFGSDGSDLKPHHVREGAFPPSRLCTMDSEAPLSPSGVIDSSMPRLDSMDDLVASIGLAIDDMGIVSSSDVPPPTVVEPPRGHEGRSGGRGLEIRRLSPERPRIDPLPSLQRSDEDAAQYCADPSVETVPPVPAKNDLPYLDTKSLKNALNLKRFSSLPRTPSLMSFNPLSAGSKRSSGTPSPSIAHSGSQPRLPVRKIRSTHPPAMYFADVVVKRTALERSIGYAHKINDLYSYDCGLADWIAGTSAPPPFISETGYCERVERTSCTIYFFSIHCATSHLSVVLPIQVSHFQGGLTPTLRLISLHELVKTLVHPTAPPPLPYPALAAAPRKGPSRASTMIATSSTSSSRSAVSPSSVARSPGSFLASLGHPVEEPSKERERAT
ncbi:hypothetical protein JVU11DRAFT_1457 [Chiua virens]|nr:hypothetical protein JVU11DRAFT_1457 [Chiua virens]